MWRAARTAHRSAVRLDDVLGARETVLRVLNSSARIANAVECMNVIFLPLPATPEEHENPVPEAPLH